MDDRELIAKQRELEKKILEEYPFMKYRELDEYDEEEGDGVYFPFGYGWVKLIYKMCKELAPVLGEDKIEWLQIKEKYGGMRLYCGACRGEVYDIIDKYEEMSERVCERCGKKGIAREGLGWIVTLCGSCYKEALEERKKRIEELKKESKWNSAI